MGGQDYRSSQGTLLSSLRGSSVKSTLSAAGITEFYLFGSKQLFCLSYRLLEAGDFFLTVDRWSSLLTLQWQCVRIIGWLALKFHDRPVFGFNRLTSIRSLLSLSIWCSRANFRMAPESRHWCCTLKFGCGLEWPFGSYMAEVGKSIDLSRGIFASICGGHSGSFDFFDCQ